MSADAPVCVSAAGLYAEKHRDGCYHYGLLFFLPDGIRGEQARGYSRLPTFVPFLIPPIARWRLRADLPGTPAQGWVLQIPRTWLLLFGFLPLTVALRPHVKQAIRRPDRLRLFLWLEPL